MRHLSLATLAFLALPAAEATAQCETQIVLPDDVDPERFGHAVVLDGAVAVVSEPLSDAVAPRGGAASLYELSGGVWSLAARIVPADLVADQEFPRMLALSGTAAFLGDPRWRGGTGRVLVVERTSAGWQTVQILKALSPRAGDAFGWRVAVDGDRALAMSEGTGEIAVFERGPAGWTHAQQIVPVAPPGDFGADLALSGTRFAVGGAGAVVVFEESGGTWSEATRLSGTGSGHEFGISLDLDGDHIVVGAPQQVGEKVHVFDYAPQAGWTETVLDHGQGAGFLGFGLAVDGNWLVIGDFFGSNKIFIWRRDPGGWVFHDLYESFHFADVELGATLDISGPWVLGGDARGHQGPDESGRATFFRFGRIAVVCAAAVHSAGEHAALETGGSLRVADNDFRLELRDAPADRPLLFFYGSAAVEVPFGDGLRCAGGQVFRLAPLIRTDTSGEGSRSVDFSGGVAGSGPGRIEPGSTWVFQAWFRDPQGPGGSGFNLSDAVQATFCP